MPAKESDLPDVAGLLSQAALRVDEPQRPLLVAIAERMAAERCRHWAGCCPRAGLSCWRAAQGERLGAASWRAFAAAASDPRTRETFLACAPLEGKNAACLEGLVAEAQPARS